jgi:uncharacterized small protein (DUF1192 family)
MAIADEDDRPKKPVHTIGEDLSALSIAELGERIALLGEEIRRLEAAMKEKSSSRDAAQAVFRIQEGRR